MAEAKKKNAGLKQGMHIAEFLKDHGSRKKGDQETYHSSTLEFLVDNGIAKAVKFVEKYEPKTVEK